VHGPDSFSTLCAAVPLHKIVFDEFCMFLDEFHPFRTELKDLFNGYVEQRSCHIRMTANDWIARWNDYIDSQVPRPIQSRSMSNPLGMTRKSIFYQLEYWTKLPIQHLLDPMHISKNVCKSLLEHLTGVRNISKERNDLKDSNTKRELWERHFDERGRLAYSIVPYTIERRHRSVLYNRISSIRTPSHFGVVLANAFTKKIRFRA